MRISDWSADVFSSDLLVEGLLALGFFGFSALGLRVSRFDFFWPLAMVNTLERGERLCPPAANLHAFAAPGAPYPASPSQSSLAPSSTISARPEERLVGKECVGKGTLGWWTERI